MRGKNIEVEIMKRFGMSLREMLTEMYHNQQMSQRKIAERLGISTGVVCKKFKEYNIEQRPFGSWGIGRKMSDEHKKIVSQTHKGKKLTKEQKQKMSEAKKGKPSHRKGAGIAEKIKQEYGKDLKDYLCELYWEKGYSQKEICDRLNLSTPHMARLFKRFNIPKRPIGYWCVNSGKVIDTVNIGGRIHDVTGRWKKGGYVVLVIKSHPFSDKTNGCIFEHRVKIEEKLGM